MELIPGLPGLVGPAVLSSDMTSAYVLYFPAAAAAAAATAPPPPIFRRRMSETLASL